MSKANKTPEIIKTGELSTKLYYFSYTILKKHHLNTSQEFNYKLEVYNDNFTQRNELIDSYREILLFILKDLKIEYSNFSICKNGLNITLLNYDVHAFIKNEYFNFIYKLYSYIPNQFSINLPMFGNGGGWWETRFEYINIENFPTIIAMEKYVERNMKLRNKLHSNASKFVVNKSYFKVSNRIYEKDIEIMYGNMSSYKKDMDELKKQMESLQQKMNSLNASIHLKKVEQENHFKDCVHTYINEHKTVTKKILRMN